MRTSAAIFIKQCKDSVHNLPSLTVILIYPAVAWIMITAMGSEEGMSGFFVPMFSAMHCSFAPIMISSSILSEEKEKGTLRSLMMAGVSMVNYLISLSVFVILAAMLTGSAFLMMGQFSSSYAVKFIFAMLVGTVLSTLVGLCIGIASKNVTAANGMAVPVGLVLALLPMLARFNQSIAKVAEYTYSGQISRLLEGGDISAKAVCVIAAYFAAMWALLLFLFRRSRTE